VRTLRLIAAALVLTVALTPAAWRPPLAASALTKGWRHELRPQLDRIVQEGVPGAIALVRHGGASWAFTTGVSNLSRGTPMKGSTALSDRKRTLVAALVLKLSEEGVLTLEDTVERWLPGTVPGGSSMTLRQLLNHTSGLYNYTEDPTVYQRYLDGDRAFAWEPEELVEVATSHPPLFPPGTDWSYSNTGYIVAGLIVEAATGSAIDDLLEEKIFHVTALDDTYLPVTEVKLSGPHSHGYLLPGGSLDLPIDEPLDTTRLSPSWAWTAGGVVSDANDLARFYRALLDGRVLTAGSLAEMKTFVSTGSGLRYGLGLFRIETPCGPAFGHDGDFPGFRSIVLSSEDGRRQAVLMRNASDGVSPSAERASARAWLIGYCGKAAIGRDPVARFIRAVTAME
jgi:D-alanyl-D-alanine carboxypeptidase